MLKIVIYEKSKDYLLKLKNNIYNIITREKYEMDFSLVTNTTKEINHYINLEKDVALYIMDLDYTKETMTAIDLAENIRKNNRDSYIVFISISNEHITKIFRGLIRPSGFFIKPVENNDLEVLLGDIYRDYLNTQDYQNNVLNINIGSEMYRVDYGDIIYFEAFQKKLYIFTFNQRIGYYDSLTSLEDRLNESFIRCHRSYIINKSKVKKVCFSQMIIEMVNGDEIKISRTYKNTVKENLSMF